jgi:hypothetical protein
MAERSERVAVATPAWRKRATAAFNKRGRGSRTQCANDIKCSKAAITRVLTSGGTASSSVVNKISDWLGIPRPSVEVSDDQTAELVEVTAQLEPSDVAVLLTMAKALRAKKRSS